MFTCSKKGKGLTVRIDLKSVLSGARDELPVLYSFLPEPEYFDHIRTDVPIEVDGKVTFRNQAFDFTADVVFHGQAECDRCMNKVERDYRFTFTHSVADEVGEENDDSIEVINQCFDPDEALMADILLALPGKVLCEEACKGLCAGCGRNLNEGPCGCAKNEVDPRLLKLKELLDE